jgi:hypothetical protein
MIYLSYNLNLNLYFGNKFQNFLFLNNNQFDD